MIHTNITNFRKNIFDMLGNAIKWGEPLSVSTKDGNAIILSEEEYNGLLETVQLYANPALKSKIVEGLQTPLADCVPEDGVAW